MRVSSRRMQTLASFEELLTTLEGTSGVLADTVDVPPLNVFSVRPRGRTTAAGGGSAGRCRSGEDLCRAAVGGTPRRSLGRGDLFHCGARCGACGREAGKRSHLQLLPPCAADDRTQEGLLSFLRRTSTPYPNAGGFPFRSSLEHLLRTPATALDGSALTRGAPNDAAGRNTRRGKGRPWLRPGTPSPT